METRANHLLIGIVTLLLIGGLFGFVIWLARVDIDRELRTYEIFFTDSVVGLSTGASVRYNGVPIGAVTKIRLVPNDPTRVQVLVDVDTSVQLTDGVEATLGVVGLTGVAYVELTGGGPGGAPIEKLAGAEYPDIPAGSSALQEVFRGAPDLLNEATMAVSRVSAILDEDNRAEISQILRNVNEVTAGLADSREEITNIIANLDETIQDFRDAADSINALSSDAKDLITGEAASLFNKAGDAAKGAEDLLQDLRSVVRENRLNVRQFTGAALPEATRLMADLRRLTVSLQSVAERLEGGIGDALFPQRVPEYSGQE